MLVQVDQVHCSQRSKSYGYDTEITIIINKISSAIVDLDLQRYDPYMKENTSISQPTETIGPVTVNR